MSPDPVFRSLPLLPIVPRRTYQAIRGTAGSSSATANDAGPEGRQALASALFTRLEVEGYQELRYDFTPDAVDLGLGTALPARLETGVTQVGLVGARGLTPTSGTFRS